MSEFCPVSVVIIKDKRYVWEEVGINESVGVKCGSFYDAEVTRHCVLPPNWSPDDQETIELCSRNLNLLHTFYIVDCIFVTLVTIAVASGLGILVWVHVHSSLRDRKETSHYLFHLSTVVGYLFMSIPSLAMYSTAASEGTCLFLLLFRSFCLEAESFWLFNFGLRLHVRTQNPLGIMNVSTYFLMVLGWVCPTFLVTIYIIYIAMGTEEDFKSTCRAGEVVYDYLYYSRIPTLILYVFNTYFAMRLLIFWMKIPKLRKIVHCATSSQTEGEDTVTISSAEVYNYRTSSSKFEYIDTMEIRSHQLFSNIFTVCDRSSIVERVQEKVYIFEKLNRDMYSFLFLHLLISPWKICLIIPDEPNSIFPSARFHLCFREVAKLLLCIAFGLYIAPSCLCRRYVRNKIIEQQSVKRKVERKDQKKS